MTYRGKVKDGVVILEEGVRLPEGIEVQVEADIQEQSSLSKRLLRHAGKAKGLPRDSARHHESYLYGTAAR